MFNYLVAFFLTASIVAVSAQQDCSLVRCPWAPVCAENQQLKVPPGQCCEVCVNKTNLDCFLPVEKGPCGNFFPMYFYNNVTGQCEKFVFGGCGGNRNRFLTLRQCNQTCRVIEKDPACARLPACPEGFRCEVQSGEAFCQPDCSLNNGGCPLGHHCEVQEVECVRDPCPLQRTCTDLCAGKSCKFQHSCDVFRGRAFCRKHCLTDYDCPLGLECLPQQECTIPPCPAPRICRPNCPPKCSREYCDGAPLRRLCSLPETGESTCNGECRVGYCEQCYFSDRAITPPPSSLCTGCRYIAEYFFDRHCYYRWAWCVNFHHSEIFGMIDYSSKEQFRCYRPPCQQSQMMTLPPCPSRG